MKPNLASRAATWSATHRKLAIWGWLAFVVVMIGAISAGKAVERQVISNADQYSGESKQAERALDDAGLRPAEEVVFIQSESSTVQDPGFKALISETAASLSSTKYVENVATPLGGKGGAVSEDGHSALIDFEIAGDELDRKDNVVPSEDAIAALQTENPGFSIEQFGGASANKALNETINGDVGKAGMLSLPITLVILMVALGALVAASVPLLLAITAILATMSLVVIPSQIFPLSGDVDALILLIGLAVGVDYCLFYMRREREERAGGLTARESLDVAAATSGRAVLISGLTVIIAMSGMFITGDANFISFAVATVTVVAVMMVAALFVLPAVLAWLGDRVEKGRIPFTKPARRPAGESRLWTSVVGAATRRPILSIVLAGGFLVALAIPGLRMETVNTGTSDLPRDIAVVQTYDRLKAEFPSETVATEVVVEADDVRAGAAGAGISELASQAEASKTLLDGTEVTYSDDGTVASIVIPTRGDGNDEVSIAALNEIRDELIPATVGQVEGATVNVTGDAAASVDENELMDTRLPLVFAFVLGLSFLLLLRTFRSIVIPLKAILLNLLSVFAAYGVLVLVFQDGWGESLLDFESNGGVTDWLPLFLFVILFGLSMDYHVFILTRVRELYDGGMSSDDAVRKGIAGTAGTVTSAAVVMVAVFLVFATLSFIDFKEMGIGLAAAILIDATIIRGVLLPASMKLLGDWNWYLPDWLGWIPQRRESKPSVPEPRVVSGPAS